jgi:predicted transcriptional regulator
MVPGEGMAMTTRDTSVEALMHIRASGLLKAAKMQVYEYMFEHGPCTSKEIVAALKTRDDQYSTFNARLSDLRKQGVVRNVGKTKCPLSNRTVQLWDVTSNLPMKVHDSLLDKSLAGLGFSSLDEYGASPHWVQFKADYFSRHPRTCFVSGVGAIESANVRINLHHVTYERLGMELDEDVVPLSGFWHMFVHRLARDRTVKLKTAHVAARACFLAARHRGSWDAFEKALDGD